MRTPRLPLLPAVIAALAILLFAGCHNDSGSSAAPITTSSTEIGPEGGTARSSDGRVTLTVPEGALEDEQTITITVISPDDLGLEFDGLDILSAYELGPDGQAFAAPVTVSLLSDQTPVADADSLAVNGEFLLTSENGAAILLDNPQITADADASTVTIAGELGHFSPLVRIQEGFLFSVENIPDTLSVNDGVVPLDLSVSAELIQIDQAAYVDKTTGPFLPTDTTTRAAFAALFEEGDSNRFSHTEDYACTEGGQSGYMGEFFVETSEEQPAEVRFGQISLTTTLKKTVLCTTPDTGGDTEPDPASALQTGVFSPPAGLSHPEAAFLVPRGFGAYFNTTGVQLQMAGDEGDVVFDPVSGTVLLDRTSPDANNPTFGAIAVSHGTPSTDTAAALFRYGPGQFGGFLVSYSQADQEFSNSGQLIQGSFTDAYPAGGDGVSDEILACDGSSGGPMSIRYDATCDCYDQALDENSFRETFDVGRSCVSMVTSAPEGPVLSVSITQNNFTDSRLYFTDRTGDAIEVGVLGVDARRVRHRGNVAAVTLFADDALRLLTWDGQNAPAIVGDPVVVGDGPVDLDLFALSTGNTLIVSTGFNDDSVTLTEVDGGANLVSSTTYPAPGGCEAPAHAIFVPNPDAADAPFVVGTCFASSNYFVATEESLASATP